jgi:hypothetical protein
LTFYEPHARDRELLQHDPFKALVAPRPIGWVSTRWPGGELNLAPYSYFILTWSCESKWATAPWSTSCSRCCGRTEHRCSWA